LSGIFAVLTEQAEQEGTNQLHKQVASSLPPYTASSMIWAITQIESLLQEAQSDQVAGGA
jgi:hypothetical protein